MKIGVMVDSFRLGFLDGVKKAAEIGAQGLQVYSSGDLDPENMTPGKIAEYKKAVADSGLVISAICGDLGGHGFARAEDNIWKIEKSKRIVDLALSLGSNIITTHIGCVPADENSETRKIMAAACQELGEYADKMGAKFAIETGPEPAAVLRGFLDSLSTDGIGVNFDPANLVMVIGEDPSESVKILGKYIYHTHAKDGIMLQKTTAERIYGFFADGGIEDMRMSDYFIEVPLGEGKVDFDRYLPALASTGFDGFLTIEREVGENPEADIRMAVDFLKKRI